MSGKNSERAQWESAADSWVDFVRKGKDFCRIALNNPATFKLIGNVRDLQILDLACGEGYNTRILAHKGGKVTGVDASEKLVELARSEEAREQLGIKYILSDANDLSSLPDGTFDLVVCTMALHAIKDYKKTVSEASRVLKSGGRFVFSIPHPCFEIEKNYNEVNYSKRTADKVEWKMERLLKPFETTSFHRTLSDYVQTLSKNRLLVKQLVETQPTKEAAEKYPVLKQFLNKPHAVIFECIKIV